mmetsp:Transcript_29356/g.78834  ORF Transcript_29356/g.78834 Transcript_29356/m.78834 type:complete len:407 (+) Transcript_29356:575-1795(+)
MLLDELDERVARLLHGNGALHNLLSNVEIDLAWRASHIAKVSVCHLAGAVDDAAHDCNGHAWEVARLCGDLSSDGLQVEERAAARGARDELGLCVTHARALEHGKAQRPKVDRRGGRVDHDAIAEAIHEESSQVHAHADGERVRVGDLVEVAHEDDGRVCLGPREHLEDAARRVHGREALGRLHEGEHRVEAAEAEQRLVRFCPVHAHREAQSARRQLGLLHAALGDGGEVHHGNRPRDGRCLEGGRVGKDPNARALEAADGEACLLVVCGRHVREDNRIYSGDVLEGEAHGELAAQGRVELLGSAELFGAHTHEHRAIAVEKRAHVKVTVALALLRELAAPAAVALKVARGFLKLSNPCGRSRHGGKATAGKCLAGHHLELRVLSEGHAHGVAQAVLEQRPNADG